MKITIRNAIKSRIKRCDTPKQIIACIHHILMRGSARECHEVTMRLVCLTDSSSDAFHLDRQRRGLNHAKLSGL